MTSDGNGQVREVATRDPDVLIRRAGTRGNPGHDQHLLVDDRVADHIPTYLPEEADHSHIFEIGGGPDILTDRLLSMADRVTVVGQDRTLAAHLRREFADEVESDRLTIVEGDALDVNPSGFTACISNLPYDIPSEISFRLLPRDKPLVLMPQKEFGERMAAETGTSEYGHLSASTQHYGEVELCKCVPREAFDPKPAVQSIVVRITPRKPEYEVDGEAFFLDFVEVLFTQRRETIRDGIRNTAHTSGLSDPEVVVEAAGEDVLRKRAGNMTPAEFAGLTQLAASVGR